MNVLVAVASRHGATYEIGERIADRLADQGVDARVEHLQEGCELDGYDAYVLGSSVYLGKWQKEARRFLDAHAVELRDRPVWLFSSGPLSEGGGEAMSPDDVQHLVTEVKAGDHRSFPGRLDPAELRPGERIVAAMVHAPAGDFRDWDAIDSWADDIADFLDLMAIDGQIESSDGAG